MANTDQASTQQEAAAFTPGPWRLLAEEGDKPYIRVRGTRMGLRYKIANVIFPIYAGMPPAEGKETRANAHLIAAAPALYEALVSFVYEFGDKTNSATVNKARAALSLARGS